MSVIRPRITPRLLLLVFLAISIIVSAGLMIAAPKPPPPVFSGASGGPISNPSLPPPQNRTPTVNALPPSDPPTSVPPS